jgi:hypothetical protein
MRFADPSTMPGHPRISRCSYRAVIRSIVSRLCRSFGLFQRRLTSNSAPTWLTDRRR